MNTWRVELKMAPIGDYDHGVMVTECDNRESAERTGLQQSCMNGTRLIHVFGPDGTLEYSYHRRDNYWRAESPEAQRLKAAEVSLMSELMKANPGITPASLAQMMREARQ